MGNKDRLSIDIAIDTGNKEIPLEFLITRKKDLKAKLKSYEYLTEMLKPSTPKHYKLSDSLLGNKNSLIV